MKKIFSARTGHNRFVILYALFLLLAFTACHRGRTYFPSDMAPQEVEIVRFDNALLNVHDSTVAQDIRVLYDEFPLFMPMWVEDILGIPTADTAFLEQALPQFLNDTTYGFRRTNQREQEMFADISDLQESVNQAFTKIKYLYPETDIPTLYLFISGFNAPVYFNEDIIGVGADMYLGSDYEYYNRVVYEYQKQTMRPECIPVDIVSAWLFRTLPYTSTQSRLLEQMLYRGKIMFLTAQIFDTLEGFEIMGWTKEQWEWCERNEEAIWHLVMDKRDLFKTESVVLTSYLNDGPFTAEISQDSPGRVGIWLGWRIAESYMEHNEAVTLQQLMAEGDAQKILEESYYKP
ncbi:MAG: hypothetical protein IJ548_01085 [Paludibacteraceae bacterium]|nr:hypothetical protein [Paludibacteraceae bacterium]MBQ9296427.1 hypothetical protein [Paludibacteraceae bacterium]